MDSEIKFEDNSKIDVLPPAVVKEIDDLAIRLTEIVDYITESLTSEEPEELILENINNGIEDLYVNMRGVAVSLMLNTDEEALLGDIRMRNDLGPGFLAFILSGLKGCLEERKKWKCEEMSAIYYYDLYFELEERLKRFQETPSLQNLYAIAEKSMMVEVLRKSRSSELTIDFNTVCGSQARNVANGDMESILNMLAKYLENVIALKNAFALQID
jgi:hypothetical protein